MASDRDRTPYLWGNVLAALASLSPSTALSHLRLTLIAWKWKAAQEFASITDEVWNPVIHALSRFNKLTRVEVVLIPYVPWVHRWEANYDQTLVKFFERPLNELFPRTRRYIPCVTFQQEPDEKAIPLTYPFCS